MTRSLFDPIPPVLNRSIQELGADTSAVRAIAQAAINVELFTIPLYMTTLYSIHGMHEINASGQTFYKGRIWPGASTSSPGSPDEKRAFFTIFSVFVQEMLHLQLAANVAAVLGAVPSFTNNALQDPSTFAFTCYGPDKHVIPHIIDLRDTETYADVCVDTRALDREQLRLFLAIEEPERAARERIKRDKRDDYFPAVPFAGWTPSKGEADLPLFGSIGYMYECLVAYLNITYDDGTTLFGHVFSPGAVQCDIFSTPSGGHPMAEYPGFPTVVPTSDRALALGGISDIISSITDQGEGSTLGEPGDSDVEAPYQSSKKALELDYPSYNASGEPVPSADARARYKNDKVDHYARFGALLAVVDKVLTWPKWHAGRGDAPWTAADLQNGPDEASPKIPAADMVAGALNRLKEKNLKDDGSVHRQLSQVAVGSIHGITSVLDTYWQGQSGFPFPAMGGSGDRVSICWAVLGVSPDLGLGVTPPPKEAYHHACQGLDLTRPGAGEMPADATFHTCIGSNQCKGQGGCGFVQKLSGGGSCGTGGGGGGGGCHAVATSTGKGIDAHLAAQAGCGFTLYSAPADNACNGFGGCAVPISASQLYPKSGVMQLFDILSTDEQGHFVKVGIVPFERGEPVYQTAWKAYLTVLEHRGVSPLPEEPPADDLRLAFPPST